MADGFPTSHYPFTPHPVSDSEQEESIPLNNLNWPILGLQLNKGHIGPSEENEKQNDLIRHELIDLVGSTTNVLIYCLLDNSPKKKFTRESIREGIDKHVKSMQEEMGADSQHIARIQTGKAAVNYWIDRMVESGTFDKKHSKPVEFWIKNRDPSIRRKPVNPILNPIIKAGGWGL